MAKKKKELPLFRLVLITLSAGLAIVVVLMLSLVFVNSYFWRSLGLFESYERADLSLVSENGYIIASEYIGPTTYKIELNDVEIGDRLILDSEFDAYWFINDKERDYEETGGSSVISSSPTSDGVNSFILSRDGDYTVETFHIKRRWTDTFVVAISAITLLLVGFISIRKVSKGKSEK